MNNDLQQYEETTQAQWAEQEQLNELEYIRHEMLVNSRYLAENDPKKYVRTAAAIMVAQLEKANSEVNNGHQSTQQAVISF